MGPGQRKTRERRMIEERRIPRKVAMAAAAARAVSPCVHVVARVAHVALQRRADERLVAMTSAALRLFVRSGQRKLRRAMIEAHVGPSGLGMAVAARGAENSHVGVVRAMAADTRVRGVSKLDARRMAVCTRDVEMRVVQRKLGQPMIESCRIESRDPTVTALVLLVARAARTRDGNGIETVEAAPGDAIGLNLGVACPAKRGLAFAALAPMTARAAILDQGVGLDHEPGHHEPLETEALCVRTRAEHQHDGRRE